MSKVVIKNGRIISKRNIKDNEKKINKLNILMYIVVIILTLILLITGMYFVGVLIAYFIVLRNKHDYNQAAYSWFYVFYYIFP